MKNKLVFRSKKARRQYIRKQGTFRFRIILWIRYVVLEIPVNVDSPHWLKVLYFILCPKDFFVTTSFQDIVFRANDMSPYRARAFLKYQGMIEPGQLDFILFNIGNHKVSLVDLLNEYKRETWSNPKPDKS